MGVNQLQSLVDEQDYVKWSTVEKHLNSTRLSRLEKQLRAVTMIQKDGEPAVPSRDLRRALNSRGLV